MILTYLCMTSRPTHNNQVLWKCCAMDLIPVRLDILAPFLVKRKLAIAERSLRCPTQFLCHICLGDLLADRRCLDCLEDEEETRWNELGDGGPIGRAELLCLELRPN